VHCHPTHDDYLILLSGRATFGLVDLRAATDSGARRGCVVELTDDVLTSIAIPHGVAHGFYFHEPSLHVYAVTHYWDLGDELACHWADPELGIPWPRIDPHLSPRDAAAGSLSQLLADLAASDL
jgi:dTDP-4-dehydrorhamnose 3,5-epimerase